MDQTQKEALTLVASKNIIVPMVLPETNDEDTVGEIFQISEVEVLLEKDTKRKRYFKEIPKKYRKDEEWEKQLIKKPNKLRRNEVR